MCIIPDIFKKQFNLVVFYAMLVKVFKLSIIDNERARAWSFYSHSGDLMNVFDVIRCFCQDEFDDGISCKEAVEIARQYYTEQGWLWLEPVWVYEEPRHIRIEPRGNFRGAPSYIVISKSSGAVTKTFEGSIQPPDK